MTPEQAALLKKAQDSLQASKSLASQGFADFSVSRSYYAMFYVAQTFLLGKGLSFSKHSAVIAAFGQHFAKTAIVPPEFHRYLIEAQEDRNIGDYGITTTLSVAEAEEQIGRAELFLRLAKEHIA